MKATVAEKEWLMTLVRQIRQAITRLPGAELLTFSGEHEATATHAPSDGWYMRVAEIGGMKAALYAFVDNSHPTAPRALWYGASDTTRRGINAVEEAGWQRWPYTQRYKGDKPPTPFRYEDPWFQRYAPDEYYYGWLEREPPPTNKKPPKIIVERIAERFSDLLVEIGRMHGHLEPLDLDVGDSIRPAKIRREQARLRARLFSGSTARCYICNRDLPIDLLVAAHIKARSRCTESERRDIGRNIIPLCILGCDGLFERGYIVIRGGKVVVGPRTASTVTLERIVANLVARATYRNEPDRAEYFESHAAYCDTLALGKDAT